MTVNWMMDDNEIEMDIYVLRYGTIKIIMIVTKTWQFVKEYLTT